jgi:hypothetical protein
MTNLDLARFQFASVVPLAAHHSGRSSGLLVLANRTVMKEDMRFNASERSNISVNSNFLRRPLPGRPDELATVPSTCPSEETVNAVASDEAAKLEPYGGHQAPAPFEGSRPRTRF